MSLANFRQLADYNHWANKHVNWPTLFKEKVKQKFKSDVTIVNPAMGGTELRQNAITIPRWSSKTPEPDLVTICFGGNDWKTLYFTSRTFLGTVNVKIAGIPVPVAAKKA